MILNSKTIWKANILGILVMHESQSHRSMKVSKAMIVSIDEVKGQGSLDWTAATSWWSTYQTGPVTASTSPIELFISDQNSVIIIVSVSER